MEKEKKNKQIAKGSIVIRDKKTGEQVSFCGYAIDATVDKNGNIKVGDIIISL